MSNKHLGESFYHAFEGLSHAIWTQRHVRVQLIIVALALALSYVMHLEPLQLLFVVSAATLVLMAELFNTAVEVVVNMITETYHPLAKIAKDVAAAGVLIASMYAFLVGVTVFVPVADISNWLAEGKYMREVSQPDLAVIILLGIAVVSIIIPVFKVRVGHGTLMRGGAVSAHTAVAFLLFAAIAVKSDFKPLISIPAFILALLVAQSRVEGKIHTVAEVLWGATVALIVMTVLMLIRI
ncbi:MAG: diacylglycerol kinase [Armatimonadota bacterium]